MSESRKIGDFDIKAPSIPHSCGKNVILMKISNFLSAIAVIPLTVNEIASSGGLVRYSRRFRYSGRRYRLRSLYFEKKFVGPGLKVDQRSQVKFMTSWLVKLRELILTQNWPTGSTNLIKIFISLQRWRA